MQQDFYDPGNILPAIWFCQNILIRTYFVDSAGAVIFISKFESQVEDITWEQSVQAENMIVQVSWIYIYTLHDSGSVRVDLPCRRTI